MNWIWILKGFTVGIYYSESTKGYLLYGIHYRKLTMVELLLGIYYRKFTIAGVNETVSEVRRREGISLTHSISCQTERNAFIYIYIYSWISYFFIHLKFLIHPGDKHGFGGKILGDLQIPETSARSEEKIQRKCLKGYPFGQNP